MFALDTAAVVLRLRGHPISKYPGRYSGVVRVAFSSTGQYLASSATDGSMAVWNLQTGQQVAAFAEDHGLSPSDSLTFLADEHTILAIGGCWSMAYEARDTASKNTVLQGEIPAINTAAIVFAPDGMTYARGGEDRSGLPYMLPPLGSTVDAHIYIEQLAPGAPRLIRTLTGHRDWVTSLAMSQDGKLLVSGSSDHTVRLWNMGKEAINSARP